MCMTSSDRDYEPIDTAFSCYPHTALVVFSILTWPVWRWLWGEWMGNSYYSHGVLIPPVSLFLVYQRFRHDPALFWRAMGSNGGLVVVAVSLALYLYFLNGKAIIWRPSP